MKILISRINKGEVRVEGKIKAAVNKGLAVFAGIEAGDRYSDLILAAQKIANIRIFEDESGKFSFSLKEKRYSLLCVPNFTLCASTKKGRRPSFEKAMSPKEAEKKFDMLIELLQNKGLNVEKGIFGAEMDINLELNGPVNINLEINR